MKIPVSFLLQTPICREYYDVSFYCVAPGCLGTHIFFFVYSVRARASSSVYAGVCWQRGRNILTN